MRWLVIWFGLGVLACSSTPPTHTKEEPHPTTAPILNPQTKPTTSPTSAASTRPKGASGSPLLLGSVIQISEISKEDPLSKDAASLLGLLCFSEGKLFLEQGGYAQGEALCGPQKKRINFTRAKVSIVYGSITKAIDPNPEARFVGKSVAAGRAVKLHSIAPSDAYFKRASSLIGLSCVVTRELKNNGEDWFSGTVKCSDPLEFLYFSKVSVQIK